MQPKNQQPVVLTTAQQDEADQKNIIQAILKAKERQQPYLNLVNKLNKTSIICSEKNIKEYKKIKLRSLYYRTDELKLDEAFANYLNGFTASGIREIFIFCDKEKNPALTTEAFNKFLKDHQIRINLRIAPISQKEIIEIQTIGKKDLLNFDDIDKDYNIVYQELVKEEKKKPRTFNLRLLNDAQSGGTILDNHILHKNKIHEHNNFKISEPDYVKKSEKGKAGDIVNELRRTKLLKKGSLEFNEKPEVNQEVALDQEVDEEHDQELDQNIDINVDQQIEKELSIDEKQLGCIFNEKKAKEYAENKRSHSYFCENSLLAHIAPTHYWHNALLCLGDIQLKEKDVIKKIFTDPRIKCITQNALDLMLPYWELFTSGINLDNVPIGLAFDTKKGFLFASEERLASMPVTEATINLNYALPSVSDPLMYSWLPFATQGSLNFDDVYGSSYAPKIKYKEHHPSLNENYFDKTTTCECGDLFLDIPYNQIYKSSYTMEENKILPEYNYFFSPLLKKAGPVKEIADEKGTIFSDIKFYNLTEKDKERLKIIWQELKKRGIESFISKILLSSMINDGGWLLEEKTAAFLNKLFVNILPESSKDKQIFFKDVLSNIRGGELYVLEDVFEGLNFAYEEFQRLLALEKITDEKRVEKLNAMFQNILYKQLSFTTAYKVTANRVITILKFNAFNCGSLEEQLEFLQKNWHLATEPKEIIKAEKLKTNVVHSCYLSGKTNDNQWRESNSSVNPIIKAFNENLEHLSSVPTHLRPSINTYIYDDADNYNQNKDKDKHYIKQNWEFSDCNIEINHGMFCCVNYLTDGVYNEKQEKRLEALETCEYIESKIFDPKELETINTRLGKDIQYYQYKGEKEKEERDSLLKNKNLQNTFKRKGHVTLGVVTENANLVKDFTTRQTYRNLYLLDLNIRSSTGRHYSKSYPDQEFGSYSALFEIIFDELKFKDGIKIGTEELCVNSMGNIDTKISCNAETNIKSYDNEKTKQEKNQQKEAKEKERKEYEDKVKEKEKKHEEIITLFCKLYDDNPEFNFSEIVSLGLVTHLCEKDIGENTIKYAKEMIEQGYGSHFSQLLRVLIATPLKKEENPKEALKYRAENIARNLKLLNINHKYLTNGGKNPENLVLFAACLDRESEEDAKQQLSNLLAAINTLDSKEKQQVLNNLSLAKLPFSQNSINSHDFPQFTINDLKNKTVKPRKYSISYDKKTRFNDIKGKKLLYAPVDLTNVERKHNIIFINPIKKSNFIELKRQLLITPDFVKSNISDAGKKKLIELSALDIKKIEYDFARDMFANIISERNLGWEDINNKSLELLYDQEKNIHEQFSNVVSHKEILDDLLDTYNAKQNQDKSNFLHILLQEPRIPFKNLGSLLSYLRSLLPNIDRIGPTVIEFLDKIPKELYVNNFQLFKIATGFLIDNPKFNIKQADYYRSINRISNIPGIANFIDGILKYCAKTNTIDVLTLVLNLNSESKNYSQILEWLLTLKPEIIAKIAHSKNIDLQLLFTLKEFKKTPIITNIVFNFDDILNTEQYEDVISYLKKCSLDEAKLLESYLVFLSKTRTEKNIIENNQDIERVLNNIGSLEKVKDIFSDRNLERFNYKKEEVEKKISEIQPKGKVTGNKKKGLFINNFDQVMRYCKYYKDFDYNQLRAESLRLKHDRALHKVHQNEKEPKNKELDLRFLALSIESMYRSTGKFPWNTQILSILNTVLHEKHIIDEIATSQGKSIITALMASYLWFTGQTVDVATSSEELMLRDLETFSPFFESLGIDHNKKIITAKSDSGDYIKGGINYATTSNLALFRANQEFYSKNTYSSSVPTTHVSLICDEVDDMITSSINYKLTVPLIDLSQHEIRALFGCILNFTNDKIFQNEAVSRKDDIENLKKYLEFQFQQRDSTLHYPLKPAQLEKLQRSTDQIDVKLYNLCKALDKCYKKKDCFGLLDELLDAANIAKGLKEGVDFISDLPINSL